MRKIFCGVLLACASFSVSIAKTVDEPTARTAGYNFCKSQGVITSGLTLAYKATSTINGASVVDFYLFNTGSKGFVMVAGDDRVTPVLGFSDESSFTQGYLPSSIADWFDNYSRQINYVIANNTTAAPAVENQWHGLISGQGTRLKTTATVVMPLLKTFWNQSPNYNYLCPFDAGAGTNVVTGCVATAMAQVMKYWNWPRRGVGAHSYTDGGYGTLTANFGTTVYQWDSMPSIISDNNPAIGILMYQAGVSVDMSYGVSESGAGVMNYGNPIVNCTQNALPAYFSYKSSLQGVFRSSYSDTDWVHMLKAELDASRPVIYAGYGSDGGHCFIADGYITNNRFHFNWGWGGYLNGYYIVENLAPGTTAFNDGQSMLVGIEPDGTVVAGVKELASIGSFNVYPNPASSVLTVDVRTAGAATITIMDMAGREVAKRSLSAGTHSAVIDIRGLANGAYFAVLNTAGGTKSCLFTVAK